MDESLDVSVIICTYNRCDLLKKALESLLAQECTAVSYEILIVDNNSTDQTRHVCDEFLAQCQIPARYLFEPKQGVAYARNTAILEAKAPILAFTDDDVCVDRKWIARIKRAFDACTEASGIGGKVLPRWEDELPSWLTREHWAPLALQDYGDAPKLIRADNPLCLVAANLAVRRQVFDRTGLFSPTLQRVKNSIGSMEDHEFHLCLWEAGYQEMYLPDLVVYAEIQPERLTKSYHRRWHEGHGHFYALLRDQQFESSLARLFDVPAHLYKQAIVNTLQWLIYRLAGKSSQAFACEVRLYFFAGFFRTRRDAFRRSNHHGIIREIAAFLYSLARQTSSKRLSG
jgi:glycosyltransferase involved in cell wall biosynthesis